MIENTRDISVWLPWYAISAMQFARRYIEPKQDQETYNTIYNIYYLFFKQLDEEFQKMWYKKCPECLAYYDNPNHNCDWLMKMLVAMWKANGKQIYFTDCTTKSKE
jgi:hypothetical protein